MIDYTLILAKNYFGKQWSLNGNSYDGLDWLDSSPKPTQAELDALWESTQAKVIADQQAAVEAKQTAIAKLTALGLTAGEIAALGVK
jgi:hypothetical protein